MIRDCGVKKVVAVVCFLFAAGYTQISFGMLASWQKKILPSFEQAIAKGDVKAIKSTLIRVWGACENREQFNAFVNARLTKWGHRPLHIAASGVPSTIHDVNVRIPNAHVIQALLAVGARRDIKTAYLGGACKQKTPFDLARDCCEFSRVFHGVNFSDFLIQAIELLNPEAHYVVNDVNVVIKTWMKELRALGISFEDASADNGWTSVVNKKRLKYEQRKRRACKHGRQL